MVRRPITWDVRGVPWGSIMQKVFSILLSKIVYVLKRYTIVWYYVLMSEDLPAAALPPLRLSAVKVTRFRRRGQTLVEYALILAVLSIVAIGVLLNLGQQVKGVYTVIDSVVSSAAASH